MKIEYTNNPEQWIKEHEGTIMDSFGSNYHIITPEATCFIYHLPTSNGTHVIDVFEDSDIYPDPFHKTVDNHQYDIAVRIWEKRLNEYLDRKLDEKMG